MWQEVGMIWLFSLQICDNNTSHEYEQTLRNTSNDELDRVYKVRFVLVVVKITGINSGYVSQFSFFFLFSRIASIYYIIFYYIWPEVNCPYFHTQGK